MFADRIRYIRKRNNLTVEQAANKLGLSVSAFGKYERNERQPSFEVLVKIAKEFNISTDFLLGVDSNNEGETVESWLLEIKYADENKRETMKVIWEQIKKL